jgi:DNA polymerase III epsilon subunit-like protein
VSSTASRASSGPPAPSPRRRPPCTGSTTRRSAVAPTFAELAAELLALLEGAVFVAHNADFDLPLVQHAFARAGAATCPPASRARSTRFRLLEPTERSHRLESLCERHGIELDDAHDARDDALATVELLRLLLREGIAPETVELDDRAYMRARSRGDSGPRPSRRSGGSSRSPARPGSSASTAPSTATRWRRSSRGSPAWRRSTS